MPRTTLFLLCRLDGDLPRMDAHLAEPPVRVQPRANHIWDSHHAETAPICKLN